MSEPLPEMGGEDRDRREWVASLERTYGHMLRQFLARRVRAASADAADLFQEIFLRLLRLRNPESIRNPQAYLYTVASHVLYQHAAGRAAEASAGVDSEELLPQLESEAHPDPALQADLQQRIEMLTRALERLPPRASATLILYRCEGMTLDEIGKRLGVSRPMVRKYLTRALALCDQHLEEEGGL